MRVVSPAANTKFVILRERIKKKEKNYFHNYANVNSSQ